MKKLLPIIAILAIGGGVLGTAFMGIIDIPGVTPKKPKKAAPAEAKKEEKPVIAKAPAPAPALKGTPAKKDEPKADLQKGAERLAELWNEMDTETLIKVASDWKDDDLVRVLSVMDNAKVVAYLTAVAKEKPAHASKLSVLLQEKASAVPEAS